MTQIFFMELLYYIYSYLTRLLEQSLLNNSFIILNGILFDLLCRARTKKSNRRFTSRPNPIRGTWPPNKYSFEMQKNTKVYQAAFLMLNVFVISKIIDPPPHAQVASGRLGREGRIVIDQIFIMHLFNFIFYSPVALGRVHVRIKSILTTRFCFCSFY